MTYPYVTIDLAKIEHNARTIVELCGRHGIGVAGVTKGVCGYPEVARAMLRGGVAGIADSRLANIRRMRDAGIESDYLLLRLPPLSGTDAVVQSVNCSLNTEAAVLTALAAAAQRARRTHEVILMVDLGDLREGLWPDELAAMVGDVVKLSGIRIIGIGTNLACLAGVEPDIANMQRLVELAGGVESIIGHELQWISAANSSGLKMIAAGRMPARINHARIGEAILLGRETIHREPWPATYQDAFTLHAEILELKRKPSLPIGHRGEDAFGAMPDFEDHGLICRALVNVGHADMDPDLIAPRERDVQILSASSDYLVLDVTAIADRLDVGDDLCFDLSYGALLHAMSSEYVQKRPLPTPPS